jgi:glycosyltransferase involved in cell wall biosynthesis
MSDRVRSVSIVVPIHNEVESLPHLYEALTDVLPLMGRDFEMIFVDDGSRDGSARVLRELAQADGRVKVIELRSNFGQSAAMMAGIQAAGGDVVVTMDGDLQNEPADIPPMVERIEEGYDLVHGWRRDRRDALLRRRIPSRLANWLISRATGFPVRDLGCTLKAMRREIAQELELYGEMHRFIPILAHWRGARCVEVVTAHHPRRFGRSKYGLSRGVRVLLDLLTVKYFIRYLASPMKLFGMVGLVCGVVSLLAAAATAFMKLSHGTDMTGNPLLLLAVLSAMVAAQFVAAGMLGEIASRMYYAVRGRRPYAIRRTINFDAPSASRPRLQDQRSPLRRSA